MVVEALADNPDVVTFAGHNISAHYIKRLREQLKGKRVAINVISKSGTTTEPAIAFRIMRDLVGCDVAKDCIVATTDANKGALLDLAEAEGYERFVVPDDDRRALFGSLRRRPAARLPTRESISTSSIAGAASAPSSAQDPDPLTNPGLLLRRRAEHTLQQRHRNRAPRLLRAAAALPCRVVEAALRRKPGQGQQSAIPGLRRLHHRPALHGPVYPAGPPHSDGDVPDRRRRASRACRSLNGQRTPTSSTTLQAGTELRQPGSLPGHSRRAS